jgi:hypothetical protein
MEAASEVPKEAGSEALKRAASEILQEAAFVEGQPACRFSNRGDDAEWPGIHVALAMASTRERLARPLAWPASVRSGRERAIASMRKFLGVGLSRAHS